jgi:hypothetical protein
LFSLPMSRVISPARVNRPGRLSDGFFIAGLAGIWKCAAAM